MTDQTRARTVRAQVGIVADGTYTPAPDTNDIDLWIDDESPSHVCIEADLDLGIAGQLVQISVPAAALARAVRSLIPVAKPAVGEAMRDIDQDCDVTVRADLGDGHYRVASRELGEYRVDGALLIRHRRMESDR